MVDFGNRLKTLRKGKGLTQKQLGLQLGVNKATICSYENGTRRPPYENLILLAEIYNVTTDYLLGVKPKDSLDISGLTNDQVAAVESIIKSMRN